MVGSGDEPGNGSGRPLVFCSEGGESASALLSARSAAGSESGAFFAVMRLLQLGPIFQPLPWQGLEPTGG